MNIEFGKVENGKMIYVPDVVRVDGHDVISPNAEQCARAEGGPYLRNENNEPMPPEGFYSASFVWDTDGGKNFKQWDYKPIPQPPPKVYNKYRLGMAIENKGYLNKIIKYFAAYPQAKFHWDNAQEFVETDTNFNNILNILKIEFGEDGVNAVFAEYERLNEEAVNA